MMNTFAYLIEYFYQYGGHILKILGPNDANTG